MRARELVLLGLFSAALTAGKLALSLIPNVEIVTLLFILFTVTLGVKKTLLISFVFVTTEILIYGFSTWVLIYYLVWPLLIFLTAGPGRLVKSEYGYAIIAGLFGLSFGLFFALGESLFYGVAYGFTYWLRGLPLDLLHGVSNFILTLVLWKPLKKFLADQVDRYLAVE